MRFSRTIWWTTTLLFTLTLGIVITYRGFHKYCCTEELTEAQLVALTKAAGNGDVPSMKRLYFYFEEGEEPEKANVWLRKAAAAGDPQAEVSMYQMLFGSKDASAKQAAVRYLARAARQGSSDAKEELQESFRARCDTLHDGGPPICWLRRCASSGDPDCVLALCDLAVERREPKQSSECWNIESRMLMQLNPRSGLAGEVMRQREALAEIVRDHAR